MDRGAWRATVHEVSKSRTRLSDWAHRYTHVWEHARVWAHWKHCFDVHLSYLRPISCLFSSWVSLGCTTRGGGCCNDWLLEGEHPVSILSSLCAYCRVAVVWWLDGCNILCFLIEQATFFHWQCSLLASPLPTFPSKQNLKIYYKHLYLTHLLFS